MTVIEPSKPPLPSPGPQPGLEHGPADGPHAGPAGPQVGPGGPPVPQVGPAGPPYGPIEVKPGPPAPPEPWLRWVDIGIRAMGLLLAVVLTVLTALFEAFYTPLYLNGHRVPVSIVAAVVLNLGLIWFTVVVTGRRLPVVLIAVVWMAVMVVASSRKDEGDLVLTDNNWVGIVTMLVGSLTYAVAGYRLVLTAFRPKI